MSKFQKRTHRLTAAERRAALAVVVTGLEANMAKIQTTIDALQASNPILGETWRAGMLDHWRKRLGELRATRDRLLHEDDHMQGKT